MKKKIIFGLAVVIFISLTQIVLVKLVYAHKIGDNFSNIIAKAYHLKAGEVQSDELSFSLYLDDYFEHKFFIEKFIDKQLAGEISGQPLITKKPTEDELRELVWYKILKDAWLEKVAEDNDIVIKDNDLTAYFESVGGEEVLKEDVSEYDISYKQYKKLVIDFYILESKVHQYFLDTYSDRIGAQKAQEAYAMLESGDNFDEVAKKYADDLPYAQNSIFLKEADLIDSYEPIKDLEIGGFSKIVKVPTGYIIWRLDSISENDGEKAWEVRGIFIAAQTIDNFLDEYLSRSSVKKLY